MPQPRKYSDHAARQAAYRARCEQTRQSERKERGLPASAPLPTVPSTARWKAALRSAYRLLEQVSEEMATYFDDRSETWQESDRGESFAERQETLAALMSELEPLTL